MFSRWLLIIVALCTFTGCAQVKIEMNGRPVPDYIKKIHVLSMRLDIETTYSAFYKQPEGTEFLDTWQYLNNHSELNKIDKKHLDTVKLMCTVFNPYKGKYSVRLFHKVSDNGKVIGTSSRVLYSGALSSKTLLIDLPKESNLTHEAWISIFDKDGILRYGEFKSTIYKIK